LWFRSYVQGREIFQGFELHGFWADEECPADVYEEGQVRLMTNDGISMLTFTPLNGLTALVQQLTKPSTDKLVAESRAVVQCGWDDVPHLNERVKATLLAKLAPHQRLARSKGVPSLGAGAIYPVPEEDFVVDDFQLPAHWPRAYGLDVGWNRTAGAWGAIDRETDTVYLYSEHYRGQAEPSVHATAVKSRGEWIPGAIDPAARGRSQVDGTQLIQSYTDLGLQLSIADNAVESGLYDVWERMSTGRFKVFKSCQNWLTEYRIYRRDLNGKIVKENDHLMDATRYLVKTGLNIACVQPRIAKAKPRLSWRTS
jgi:phage terminase large subunit-like protein